MILVLLIGVALWWGAHLFKRVAPVQRAMLADRMGNGAKGLMAGVLALSVVLMVLGYRGAPWIEGYTTPEWTRHLNNLMMLVAIGLFGLGNSKSRARGWLRHPMLWGFVLFATAHLLVNGHVAAIILFGGLLLWALLEMVVINRSEPDWTPKTGGTVAGDVRLAVSSVIGLVVIGLIHGWLGRWPFG